MKMLFFLLSLCLGTFSLIHGQATHCVPDDFSTIQAAVDHAAPGDHIKVAAGVYDEQVHIRTSGLTLKGEGRMSEIAPSATNPTVILLDSVSDILIQGFYLTNGIVGIDVNRSDSIRILDNSFVSNYRIDAGISILVRDSSTARIQHNYLNLSGIAISARQNSGLLVSHNDIVSCRGGGNGAITLVHSQGDFRDNFFQANWDGCFYISNSQATLVRNRMIQNESWDLSPGMNLWNSTVEVRNCLFKGGYVDNSPTRSAGIHCQNTTLKLYNCLFAGNRSRKNQTQGLVLDADSLSEVDIRNSIFYQNGLGTETLFLEGNQHSLAYNLYFDNQATSLSNGYPLGTGNILADPAFCDLSLYHLSHLSPGLDAGDPDVAFEDVDANRNNISLYGGPDGERETPRLIPSHNYRNLGSVQVLDQVWDSWILRNEGACERIVDSARLSQGNAFVLIHYSGDDSAAPANGYYQIDIRFQTASLGTYYDTLTIWLADTTYHLQLEATTRPRDLGRYVHTLQNYDDDVFRTRTYSNLYGGNAGQIAEDDLYQVTQTLDTTVTRSGYGRSMRFDYQNLSKWYLYIESLSQSWFDKTEYFDLQDLMPDFNRTDFQNRGIDSLVFHGRLDVASSQNLRFKVQWEDTLGKQAYHNLTIPKDGQWQRYAIGMDEFEDEGFNPRAAKFLGFVFEPDDNSGTFHLDDIQLIENGYTKPDFTGDPDGLLAYLNEVSFRHFWMAADKETFLAWDRHIWNDLISVDAIGFQLSAYVIAHQNGWMDATMIEQRVEKILHTLVHDCEHAPHPDSVIANPTRYATVEGIWAHFLDNKTLARKDNGTEFSLFTNALLLAGVHVAQQYFNQNGQIFQDADSLIRMTNWNFLYRPQDSLMYYHWEPVDGHSLYYTDWFSEELDLVFLLATSNPNLANRLPFNPYHSPNYNQPCCADTGGFTYSAPGANFTYYFYQMYARHDKASSRFQNACNSLNNDWLKSQALGNDSRMYGITACEGPDSAGYDLVLGNVSNYHAYGVDCKFDLHNDPNGTFAIYGGLAPTLFIPKRGKDLADFYYRVLDQQFRQQYGYEFWSPIFGFPDAVHLNPDGSTDPAVNILRHRGPWISIPRFGIDVGPMLMNMDSYLREKNGQTSVRDLFNAHPYLAGHIATYDSLGCIQSLHVGIEEEPIETISVYPNPTHDIVSVQLPGPTPFSSSFHLRNVLGQEVMKGEIAPTLGAPIRFDLSPLPAGSYWLQIQDREKRYVGRIVKQ